MQSPRSFCRFLGIVLTIALVMVGSSFPSSADAQQVPLPVNVSTLILYDSTPVPTVSLGMPMRLCFATCLAMLLIQP
jgi:hypothetical protein